MFCRIVENIERHEGVADVPRLTRLRSDRLVDLSHSHWRVSDLVVCQLLRLCEEVEPLRDVCNLRNVRGVCEFRSVQLGYRGCTFCFPLTYSNVKTRESSVDVRDRYNFIFFFFSSRRRHTRFDCDWSSDVCSSD